MNDEDALLRAICESPDEDGPRLVCSDWLEEHGQPERAEFIRVQLERAGLAFDHPRQKALEQRERDYYFKVWEALFRLPDQVIGVRLAWPRRGFVEHASFKAWAAFRNHADSVFARHPLIRAIEFSRSKGWWSLNHVREFLASPYLSRLESLQICSYMGGGIQEGGTAALAACPQLSRLRKLDLTGNAMGEEGAKALADSPYLGNLTELRVSDYRLSAEARSLLLARFGAVLRPL